MVSVKTYNPLDNFEELLEVSSYDYDRVSRDRLHFSCSGKQGDYKIMLEWNADVSAIKLNLVISSTQSCDLDRLEKTASVINEGAWYGFFMIDGVGNSIFKAILKVEAVSPEKTLYEMENSLDNSILEADRFSLMMSLTQDNQSQNLFTIEDDNEIETLNLMFSNTKGNA
jgi:hypothetical protein